MTGPQKIILGVLTLAACMLVSLMLLMGILAYLSWVRKPLGPALSTVPPLTMPATWTPASIPDFQPPSPTVTLLPGQPVPTQIIPIAPTDTPASSQARCGGPSVMHLLLIGSDQRGDS